MSTAESSTTTRRRVAVVGSGLSGMTAAWLMARDPRNDVHVYESAATYGMQACCVEAPRTDGTTEQVNVPMRGFFETYYPNLCQLYQTTGVQYESLNHSSVFMRRSADAAAGAAGNEVIVSYSSFCIGSWEFAVPDLRNRSWREAASWIWNYFTFGRAARRYLNTFMAEVDAKLAAKAAAATTTASSDTTKPSPSSSLPPLNDRYSEEITFGEWLEQHDFSPTFIGAFVLTMLAAYCSCSFAGVRAYPASVMLEWITHIQQSAGKRLTHGARDVCERLMATSTFHPNTRIDRVERVNDDDDDDSKRGDDNDHTVLVHLQDGTSHAYSSVIFACQANQSLALLARPSQEEREVLSCFQYERVQCVVHRDTATLPPVVADRRAFNWIWYEDEDCSEIALHMNDLHPLLGRAAPLCLQSVNPATTIAADTVVKTAHFERVLVTPLSNATLTRRLPAIQGRGGVFYAGSWASRGVPLLESAVTAAMRVTTHLGCPAPWPNSLTAASSMQPLSQMRGRRLRADSGGVIDGSFAASAGGRRPSSSGRRRSSATSSSGNRTTSLFGLLSSSSSLLLLSVGAWMLASQSCHHHRR